MALQDDGYSYFISIKLIEEIHTTAVVSLASYSWEENFKSVSHLLPLHYLVIRSWDGKWKEDKRIIQLGIFVTVSTRLIAYLWWNALSLYPAICKSGSDKAARKVIKARSDHHSFNKISESGLLRQR
ncbi:hypothetical protein TNCT_433781 [Trichonephila clavata]|uniref:Uncharacterized protein n=1 Tax=Trichonephila clavata TaxID=2740835 RepID=A0A8X6HNC6_TRICU|nr:hypothetical protein TNCT_433781 [Trichonephila clavata]